MNPSHKYAKLSPFGLLAIETFTSLPVKSGTNVLKSGKLFQVPVNV